MFLLQVDNQFYQFGLSEIIRSEVEEKGRVILTESNLHYLSIVKSLWIVALPLWMLNMSGNPTMLFMVLVGVAEGAVAPRGVGPKRRATLALRSLGKGALGFIFLFIVLLIY